THAARGGRDTPGSRSEAKQGFFYLQTPQQLTYRSWDCRSSTVEHLQCKFNAPWCGHGLGEPKWCVFVGKSALLEPSRTWHRNCPRRITGGTGTGTGTGCGVVTGKHREVRTWTFKTGR